MFNRIGAKIMTLATVITCTGIVLSVLAGLIVADYDGWKAGLLVGGLGALASWLASFLLYGFGRLVDNTDIIVDFIEEYRDGIKASDESGDAIKKEPPAQSEEDDEEIPLNFDEETDETVRSYYDSEKKST